MDEESLEAIIEELLREQGLTVSTAESCTGGLVGHRITQVSGSSATFMGGVIAYSDVAKERLLGVSPETLATHGPVSEGTAREMARGARRLFGTDIALSVTGIAGPTGGTSEKPVGLVYIALSAADAEACERHVWQGDRWQNKEQAAEAALALLRRYLEERGA